MTGRDVGGVVRLVVAGEALVDLVPDAAGHLVPLPGGSPLNVAVGLGRLGLPTRYLGHLSADALGDLLASRLDDAGVGCVLTARCPAPTTLAMVHLDAAGAASYAFYLDGTSAVALGADDVDGMSGAVAAAPLHVSLGAVTLTTPGTGRALAALIADSSRRAFTSLDPNLRPAVIADPDATRIAIESAVGAVDLVKVSDEDLRALAPGSDPLDVARRWAADGTLVIVTRGAEGAVALRGDEVVTEVASPQVEVVDTVGAGDTFSAGILDALAAKGLLGADRREMLAAIPSDDLATVLRRAAALSAITVSRAGANPPWSHELT